MRKIIFAVIVLTNLYGTNAKAQLFKKLKEKVTAATSGNSSNETQNSNTEAPTKEEGAGKVVKSYTVKGEGVIDITDNDELIYEKKMGGASDLQYIRFGKKQFVITTLKGVEGSNATKGNKRIIGKNQSANIIKATQSNNEVLLTLFLYSEFEIELSTNTVEKANAVQAKILGKDISGSGLTTFAFVANDGTLITTTEKKLFGYQDYDVYFQAVDNEKALRVIQLRNTVDAVFRKSSHGVFVTTIPADALGSYKNFRITEKEFTVPVIKTVKQLTYTDGKKPTAIEITDGECTISTKFYYSTYNYTDAASFGSGQMERICSIFGMQLPTADQAKFRKEIQQPAVAIAVEREKIKARQEAEAIAQAQLEEERRRLNPSAYVSTDNPFNSNQLVYVTLINNSSRNVEVVVQNGPNSFFNKTVKAGDKRKETFYVKNIVSIKNGPVIATITEDMRRTDIIVAN
jgi:hypothetical protein